MKSFGAFFAALPLVASVLIGCGETNSNADMHQDVVGESGILHFEIDADAPLSQGTNDLRISIHEAGTDAPVTGASVGLFAVMPAMAHDSPDAAKVEEIGAGTYLARDVALPMPGRWEVHVQASRADELDKATFAYDIR